MKYNNKFWPYRWFGVWKEYGPAYKNYPSINNFIDADSNASYNKTKLRNYLCGGVIITTTSGNNFPSPFDGKILSESISFRTDGNWLWLDNIFFFIQEHNLVIPDRWYNEIVQNKFAIQNVSEEKLSNLEWPTL